MGDEAHALTGLAADGTEGDAGEGRGNNCGKQEDGC
jgi:hypothetical protein